MPPIKSPKSAAWRVLGIIMLVLMVTGCGKGEPTASAPGKSAPPQAAAAGAKPSPFKPLPPIESPPGPYGSIAVSANGLHAGFAQGKANKAHARESAIRTCLNAAKSMASGCEEQLWFRESCGALATGDNGAFGTGWGDNAKLACRWALQSCRDAGGNGCEASYFACSPGKLNGTCDGSFKSYK